MSTFTIDADFPGGNIIVDELDGETVVLRQDQRDTPEWWFYWRFRVRGAAGRTLRFTFADGDVFGARGPCVSLDGRKWRWLGRGILRDNGFTFAIPPGREEVYFSFCHPYQESHLHAFLTTHPRVQADTLTHSEQGRAVEHLALYSRHGRGKVLVTARHHACESTANYVLEGLLAAWQGHTPDAGFLRNHLDVHAIPFMDIDGVENGDQGKSRHPHDHNRDYSHAPRYASVRALTQAVDTWRAPLLLHLDLHCPWIRDGWNEEIFAVGAQDAPGGIDHHIPLPAGRALRGRPITLHRVPLPALRHGLERGEQHQHRLLLLPPAAPAFFQYRIPLRPGRRTHRHPAPRPPLRPHPGRCHRALSPCDLTLLPVFRNHRDTEAQRHREVTIWEVHCPSPR